MLMHNLSANQYALPARHPCWPHRDNPGALLECLTPCILIGQWSSPSVGAPKKAPPAWNGLAKLIKLFCVTLTLFFSLCLSFVHFHFSLSLSLFSSSLFLLPFLSPTVGLRFFLSFSSTPDTLHPVIRLSLSLDILAANYNTTSLPRRVTPLIRPSRLYYLSPFAF